MMVNAKCEPGCTCRRHKPRAPKAPSPVAAAPSSANQEAPSLPPDGVERTVELDGAPENPYRPVFLGPDAQAALAHDLASEILEPSEPPQLIETTDMVTGTTTVTARVPDGLRPTKDILKTRFAAVIRRHWRDLSDHGGNPTDRMLDDLLAAVEQVDWRGAFFQNAASSS